MIPLEGNRSFPNFSINFEKFYDPNQDIEGGANLIYYLKTMTL